VVGRLASIRGSDGEDEAHKERPFLVRHKISCQAGLHRKCQLESCPAPEGNPFCQHDLEQAIDRIADRVHDVSHRVAHGIDRVSDR